MNRRRLVTVELFSHQVAELMATGASIASGVPEGARFIRGGYDVTGDYFAFIFEHASFQEVDEDSTPPIWHLSINLPEIKK